MNSTVCSWSWALGLLFIASTPVRAQAQPPEAASANSGAADTVKVATVERAKATFLLGRAAFESGDYRTALAKYQESASLYPRPGTLYNMALCEEKLGILVGALKHFQEFLLQIEGDDPRLSDVMARVRELHRRVPKLRIDLAPGSPAGPGVSLDGVVLPVENLGADIPVEPGSHTLVVTWPGLDGRTYEINLVEGAHLVKQIESPRMAPPRAPPALQKRSQVESKNAESHRGIAAWRIAMIGVGSTAVLAGGIVAARFLIAASLDDQTKSEESLSTTKANIGFATAGIGAGAVLAAALIPAPRDETLVSRVQSWHAPTLSLSIGGIVLRGAF